MIENPFKPIYDRLNAIEGLLIDIKHQPKPAPIQKAGENHFLTIQEAAKLLSLSIPTIYSKVSRRELPVMKRGNRLYFSEKELKDYIKAGKKMTISEMEAGADSLLSRNNKGLKNGD